MPLEIILDTWDLIAVIWRIFAIYIYIYMYRLKLFYSMKNLQFIVAK